MVRLVTIHKKGHRRYYFVANLINPMLAAALGQIDQFKILIVFMRLGNPDLFAEGAYFHIPIRLNLIVDGYKLLGVAGHEPDTLDLS